MFHGQPFCACGYEGPDFMCTWHSRMGVSVLVQDRATLALRDIWIRDDGTFDGGEPSEDASGAFCHNRVHELVSRQVARRERIVPLSEFFRTEDDQITDLLCPQCRQRLRWRHTGIS